MTEVVPVTREDREAAAAIVRWQRDATEKWKQDQESMVQFFVAGFTRGIMQGIWDHHPVVQAFARHRAAALQAARESERAEVVAWLRKSADGFRAAAKLQRRRVGLLAQSYDHLADAITNLQHKGDDHGG
jgi:hypothetical protein